MVFSLDAFHLRPNHVRKNSNSSFSRFVAYLAVTIYKVTLFSRSGDCIMHIVAYLCVVYIEKAVFCILNISFFSKFLFVFIFVYTRWFNTCDHPRYRLRFGYAIIDRLCPMPSKFANIHNGSIFAAKCLFKLYEIRIILKRSMCSFIL